MCYELSDYDWTAIKLMLPNKPRGVRRVNGACACSWHHRARNLIERFFNKIKQCRRVATRHDKLAANYLAFVKLASIRIWLRANQSTPYQDYYNSRVGGTFLPVRGSVTGDGILARSGTVPAKAMRCNARLAFVLRDSLGEELTASCGLESERPVSRLVWHGPRR